MTVRYVAPAGGSDQNTGETEAQPFATILHGVGQTGANDMLYLRGGTHTGQGARIGSQHGGVIHSGTSYQNAVNICGYPGESVIVTPDYGFSAVAIDVPCSYVIIKDIVFSMDKSAQSNGEAVYLFTCDHIKFERVTLRNHQAGFGFHSAHDTPFIWIAGCKIHDIGFPGSVQGEAHGLYLTGSDGVYEDNEVWHCDGYGFHVYGNELVGIAKDPSRVKLRRNKIHDCGIHGSQEAAIVFAWGADNEAQNNEIWRCPVGIQLYTNSQNAQANNNTLDDCDIGLWAQYYFDAPSARNNILHNCRTPFVDYGGGGKYVRSAKPRGYSAVFADNFVGDPLFVDGASHNYRLQNTSPVLYAAAPLASVTEDFAGVPRPQGSAPDIGAHERLVVDPPDPEPPDPEPPDPEPPPDVQLTVHTVALVAGAIAAGLLTVPAYRKFPDKTLDTAVAYAFGILQRVQDNVDTPGKARS